MGPVVLPSPRLPNDEVAETKVLFPNRAVPPTCKS